MDAALFQGIFGLKSNHNNSVNQAKNNLALTNYSGVLKRLEIPFIKSFYQFDGFKSI